MRGSDRIAHKETGKQDRALYCIKTAYSTFDIVNKSSSTWHQEQRLSVIVEISKKLLESNEKRLATECLAQIIKVLERETNTYTKLITLCFDENFDIFKASLKKKSSSARKKTAIAGRKNGRLGQKRR